MTDLGLTPVSCACGVTGLWEPNPNHAAAIDDLKRRCEMFGTLGLTKFYAPMTTTAKFTKDDYPPGVENMRQVGEVAKQFNMTGMAEFTRASTYVATLGTMLQMKRAAAHPNFKLLLDCYHFWSGRVSSKISIGSNRATSATCTFRTSPTCRESCSNRRRA